MIRSRKAFHVLSEGTVCVDAPSAWSGSQTVPGTAVRALVDASCSRRTRVRTLSRRDFAATLEGNVQTKRSRNPAPSALDHRRHRSHSGARSERIPRWAHQSLLASPSPIGGSREISRERSSQPPTPSGAVRRNWILMDRRTGFPVSKADAPNGSAPIGAASWTDTHFHGIPSYGSPLTANPFAVASRTH